MQDARYFRAQAGLCLDIAHQMSDGTLAESLRDKAAQHYARAVDIERMSGSPGVSEQPPRVPANGNSTVVRRFFFPVDYDGVTYEDDTGELFLTLQEAEAYAEVVARELGRNNRKSIAVFLVGNDGSQLGRFPGGKLGA